LIRRPLAVLLCLFILYGPLGAAPLPSTVSTALSAMLDSAAARREPPGVVVMVVNRDETLYAHAAGQLSVARSLPMREDAIFRIHSMTKPLTSVAALMLIDQGLLKLDDSVARFIPSFTAPQVVTRVNDDGTFAARPVNLPISIRHLLTHTSGIGYGFSDPTLLQLTTRTGKPEVELPLLHDPGARWTYGASTRVLGEIIERVSGEPLDRFFDTRILRPLGMTDTFYRVPDGKLARVSSRHQRTDGRLVEEQAAAVEESPVRGDGGLYSTARDYGLFMQFLLNDGKTKSGMRLLKQNSMNALRTNQIGSLFVTTQPDADPARTRPFPAGAGRDTFSLGFQIAAAPPKGRVGRAKGSMSWGGLRNTHFWVDPQSRLGVVVMTQVLPFYDDEVMALLAKFEETLYRGLD
jgi:CubicO group peptidase (beta-lactamase class C family)